MQRNTSPTPKPTGIGLGFPTWLRKNQQKHPLEDYTIKLTPTEVQLAVVYIMEGTVFGTNGDSHLLPIGCHLNRNGQPQNLEFTDINIFLWCFDDQKINVRCHNQPYAVIWSKPKVFSFYLKNVRLQGKNGEQILSSLLKGVPRHWFVFLCSVLLTSQRLYCDYFVLLDF